MSGDATIALLPDSVMAVAVRRDKAKPMDGSQQRTSGAQIVEPIAAAIRATAA
ncbi:hypothetical protein [Lysobacter sp. CA196]|uniref:hypothetical protein n=1 Tax=Lysobacter sp. CA196 TaxID=3455606 RepID=UPI003F8D65F8